MLLLTYPLDSALKFKLVCDSSMLKMVTLPLDPLVRLIGIVEGFDKSIVTGCVEKLTVGRDMTTRDGVGDSKPGFVSSVNESQ